MLARVASRHTAHPRAAAKGSRKDRQQMDPTQLPASLVARRKLCAQQAARLPSVCEALSDGTTKAGRPCGLSSSRVEDMGAPASSPQAKPAERDGAKIAVV